MLTRYRTGWGTLGPRPRLTVLQHFSRAPHTHALFCQLLLSGGLFKAHRVCLAGVSPYALRPFALRTTLSFLLEAWTLSIPLCWYHRETLHNPLPVMGRDDLRRPWVRLQKPKTLSTPKLSVFAFTLLNILVLPQTADSSRVGVPSPYFFKFCSSSFPGSELPQSLETVKLL